MLFLNKLKEFQRQYGVSTSQRGPSKYNEFIEGIPETGLAPAELFNLLPNYSNNLRNGWTELLKTAKDHLEKSVEIAKNECVFGEFGIDISDSAFNLAEVCFLLAEYRESTQKYIYIDHKRVYKARNKVEEPEIAEGEDQSTDMFEKWEEEQLKEEKLAVLNLRKQALEYYNLGTELFKAGEELAENYHTIIQTNLTDPSRIPKSGVSGVNEIFETQEIQSAAFLQSVSETMEPDLWGALKTKHKQKVDAGEVVSALKSLITETYFFTFGHERRCDLHKYLKLNLASYVQRCVVDFPKIAPITELTEEDAHALEESKKTGWMKFTDKHSRFFYILQESPNLLAHEPPSEGENNE